MDINWIHHHSNNDASADMSFLEVLELRLESPEITQIWDLISNGIVSLNSGRIISSKIVSVELPNTRSRIVQGNNSIIYCSKYRGLKGLFRKGTNHNATTIFGRALCDAVIRRTDSRGFFTSDELPSYGVSRSELKAIIKATEAEDTDLIAMFAYDVTKSKQIKGVLDRLLFTAFEYLRKRHRIGKGST